MGMVEVLVLGPTAVLVDGQEVKLGGPRQRAVLGILTASRPAAVTTDRLADLLWAGEPPATWNQTLRSYVSVLRQALEPDRRRSDEPRVLRTGPGGYVLEPGDDCVDASRFESLTAHARRARDAGDLESASRDLAEAEALWRGEAYADIATMGIDVVRAEATRLTNMRCDAREDGFAVDVALGRHHEVVAEIERFVDAHPLRERAVHSLMLAQYRCGRQSDALATFDRLRRCLRDELGLDPMPELAALQVQVLDHTVDPAGSPATTAAEAEAGRTNLPSRRDPLVGRDRQLAELARNLPDRRLVTVTGFGGVGKTALALEAGRRALPDHADGVWLCRLDGLTEGDEVAHAMCTQLGFSVGAGADATDVLAAGLGRRQSLVVVDNCEHVLPSVTRVVDHVLARCPEVRLLATSREPLGVPGEHRFALAPLSTERHGSGQSAAVELFVARATAASGDFVLGEHNTGAVRSICERLDGIPLAIELAASRTDTMTAAEIAERLTRTLLTMDSDVVPGTSRHHSLHASVGSSYQSLRREEAALLDRLSVFAGEFDLDAVETVCASGADDVSERLRALVRKSLVVARRDRAGVRYRLLHTIRSFAADRLTPAATEQLRDALVCFYATRYDGFLRKMFVSESAEVIRLLELDWDNVRAAVQWAIRMRRIDVAFALVGHLGQAWAVGYGEVHDWAAATLALDPSHPKRIGVLRAHCEGLWQDGDVGAAEPIAREAMELAGDDPVEQLTAMQTMADVLLMSGGIDEMVSLIERGVDLARREDRPEYEMQFHNTLGLVAAYSGATDVTLERAAAIQSLAERTGSVAASGSFHFVTGEALAGSDPDAALDHLRRAVEISSAIGFRYIVNAQLNSIASIAVRQGDPHVALEQLGEIVEAWRSMGAATQMLTSVHGLVEPLAQLGSRREATVLLGASTSPGESSLVFGPEDERLAELEGELRDELGSEFDEALALGVDLGPDRAADYAVGAIERALRT